MAAQIIPVNQLSAQALRGVIEEFISRQGTDYGAVEASREGKFAQLKGKLASGEAVLLFDDESQTTHILAADDPLLKRLSLDE
jgi:uncharacterized protein YheU (UPF0270 family)